jgi:hypothetical protein
VSEQGLLKECYFGDNDGQFTKKYNVSEKDSDINKKNGFECGAFQCLPLQFFCDPDLMALRKFRPDKLCPGFHIFIMNCINFINR